MPEKQPCPEGHLGKSFLECGAKILLVALKQIPGVGMVAELAENGLEAVEKFREEQERHSIQERLQQLEEAMHQNSDQARAIAKEVIAEARASGNEISSEKEAAICDMMAAMPSYIGQKVSATMSHAQRKGTSLAVLPLDAKSSSLGDQERFYQGLLPTRRLKYQSGQSVPHKPSWVFDSLLGMGGFGEVWKIQHKILHQVQAIKLCLESESGRILKQETKTIAALQQHLSQDPHIVSVLDANVEAEPYWIAFEYIAGGTLDSYLRSFAGPMPIQESLAMFAGICSGVKSAHELSIVHRDIKPANILLGPNNQPKIADFGLGKIMAEKEAKRNDDPSLSMRGYGTLLYISPEQRDGQPADPSDDVYSLGVTLVHMLLGNTSREPHFFRADLRKLPSRPPAALIEMLGECLELPRGERLHNASELLERLHKVCEESNISLSTGAASIHVAPSHAAFFNAPSTRTSPTNAPSTHVVTANTPLIHITPTNADVAFDLPQSFPPRNPSPSPFKRAESLAKLGQSWPQAKTQHKSPAAPAGVPTAALPQAMSMATPQVAQEAIVEQHALAVSHEATSSSSTPPKEKSWLGRHRMALGIVLTAIVVAIALFAQSIANQKQVVAEMEVRRQADILEQQRKAALATGQPAVIIRRGEEIEEQRRQEQQRRQNESIPGFTFLRHATYTCNGITKIVKEYQHNQTGLEFVLIPGGTFQMGSNDGACYEKPVHTVMLSPYLMSKTEVTQGVWRKIIGNNPSYFPIGDNYPVEQVSWDDCQKFCQKAGLRLPTESEWEFAARGGSTTNYYFGNSESELKNYGWYDKNSNDSTHPVAQKAPNAYGLCDMAGNVWEWCQDWHASSYSSASVIDPEGPKKGQYRVLRGGSWSDAARRCQATFRYGAKPNIFGDDIGFRVCATWKP